MGLYLGEKKVTTNFGRQGGVDSEVIDEKILDTLTELDLANITEYTDGDGNIIILPEEEIDLSSKIVGKKNGTAEVFNDYDNNIASGEYSHAEGYGTIALGKASHAEGAVTYTLTDGVEELNTQTVTINDVSYTISGPFAYGEGSHAEGTVTFAHGDYSHAEGSYTTASGLVSHAEGSHTKASGTYSHAEGYITEASGWTSHAEGLGTIAQGAYGSHAEGNSTKASGESSHAEGYETVASGKYSHAEGGYTTASGNYSHAEGSGSNGFPSSITPSSSNDDIISKWNSKKFTLAKGDYSHAEGQSTLALDKRAHAEGYNTIAYGNYASHAEGFETKSIGESGAHAEGYRAVASNWASHAEGHETVASNWASHAEGSYTTASGNNSHAEGYSAEASGDYSHAEGYETIAAGKYQHVQGKYNIVDTENKYAHIVGNGEFSLNGNGSSNAHTLDWDGNAWFAGDITVGAENKKIATEEYVNSSVVGSGSNASRSVIINYYGIEPDSNNELDIYNQALYSKVKNALFYGLTIYGSPDQNNNYDPNWNMNDVWPHPIELYSVNKFKCNLGDALKSIVLELSNGVTLYIWDKDPG